MEEDQFLELTLEEHLAELFNRIMVAVALPILVSVISYTFWPRIAPWFSYIFIPRQPIAWTSLTFEGKLLWSISLGGAAFHYLFFWQTLYFVEPGMTRSERALLRVPKLWVSTIPFVTIAMMSLFSSAVN